MPRAALACLVIALAAPAAADEHFDEGTRLFPMSYQRTAAVRIAEIGARLMRCPALVPGPRFRDLGRNLVNLYTPPADPPDVPGIRAWIAVERAEIDRRWTVRPALANGSCEHLRERYGNTGWIAERSGAKAVPACAKDGTCADRVIVELF